MRTWALTVMTGLSLVLAGCSDDDGNTGETDSDVGTDTDDDTNPPPTPVLAGTVSNRAGAAVAGASIFLCNVEICYQQFSGDDGSYAFIRGDGDFAFKIIASGYPTASTPLITTEDGTTRTLDVTLADWDKEIAMPTAAGEHELATGFFVNFQASDIDVPETSDDSKAGGTFVADAVRMPIDEAASQGELVGVWYLEAYDAKPKSGGLPYRITNVSDLGLADGDTVEVFVHSYKSFTTDNAATTQWLSAGTATVGSSEFSGDLPYLATVAVYKQ